MMPTRLVPLAMFGGKPQTNMKIGSVTNDPEPASVLMTPATIPATAKRIHVAISEDKISDTTKVHQKHGLEAASLHRRHLRGRTNEFFLVGDPSAFRTDKLWLIYVDDVLSEVFLEQLLQLTELFSHRRGSKI